MSRTVRSVSLFALTAALAASVGSPPAEARSGGRASRSRTVRAELTPPRGAVQDRARGRIVARRTAGDRETLALEVTGLHRGARYTVSCDDPAAEGTAPAPVAEVRTRRARKGRTVLGTSGRPLPHDASLDDLAGTRIEVRDDRGLLVLAGQVPALDRPSGAAASENCRFLEEVVLEDTFDTGTVGEAPADWEVSGTDVTGIEVAVDDAVFDGASGASVRLTDGVAADPGAPVLARSFTSQDGHFAVEFTLFTGDADGRAVLRVSDSSTDPDTFATGLGDGLGLYEDGTIGFAADDPIRAASASTGYRVRVDFDVAAQTFDVTIDGETLVTGRDLGFTGTSLDRMEFGGATTTTGTAWIDTVRVIEKTLDCAPTANAGTDQVLECAGTTAVTLDGTLSADPEGAELTYTWTGDFVEGTATGATPTVHFAGHGSHEVSLVVNDGFFDSAADTVAIEIVDTTPPELTVTGLPTEVWPPNHKMVRVTPRVVATDLCDGDRVRVTLVITSNEADDGLGDGTTSGDWTIRSPSDFDLRAERSGTGTGRVYSLVWTATDSSGNSAEFAARIAVPHDQGHGDDDGDDDDGDVDGGHGNGHHGHGNSGHGNPGRGRGPK